MGDRQFSRISMCWLRLRYCALRPHDKWQTWSHLLAIFAIFPKKIARNSEDGIIISDSETTSKRFLELSRK